MKKRLYFFFILSCLFSVSHAQNMVGNADFESFSACPTSWGQLTNASGWLNGNGTPEYLHPCATTPNYRTPSNNFGVEAPHSGQAYIGMVVNTTFGWREIAARVMSTPMTAGNTYYASMWVSLGDIYPQYMINNIGMIFSNSVINGQTGYAHINETNVVSTVNGWYQITGSFVAGGNYTYVNIGNFFDPGVTTFVPTGWGSYAGGYYFFDDICVSPNAVDCNLIVLAADELDFEAKSQDDNHVNLSWRFSEPAAVAAWQLERSEDGEVFSPVAGGTNPQKAWMEHHDYPAGVTGKAWYRISVKELSGESYFSELLSVQLEESQSALTRIFPNPVKTGESVTLRYTLAEEASGFMRILDIAGREVPGHTETLPAGVQAYEFPADLAAGVYFIEMKLGQNVFTEKLVVTE